MFGSFFIKIKISYWQNYLLIVKKGTSLFIIICVERYIWFAWVEYLLLLKHISVNSG